MSPLKLGLVLAITVGAFDEMAITTVLPLIVADLGGQALYGTAFSAFVLASLLGTVWAGSRCDAEGPRRPFMVGLIIFSLGLMLATVAPNMPIFVLSRAIQGLGNGIILALVFAVVNLAYSPEQRPKTLALLSAAWVLPSLIAPTGAGAIAELSHWRWIFPALLPVLTIVALIALPILRPFDKATGSGRAGSNLTAALRLSSGVALLLALLSQQWLGLLLSLIAAASLILFIRQPFEAFMPKGIWRLQPGLAAAMGLRFCINFIFFGSEVFIPYMLVNLYQFSALQAGTVLTSSALAWAIGAWWQARASSSYPASFFLFIGASLLAMAISGILAVLWFQLSIYWIYLLWSIAGLGVGLAFTCVSAYTMSHTPPGQEGASASAAGIASALGIGLATGMAGAIFNYSAVGGLTLNTTMILVCLLSLGMCMAFISLIRLRVWRHADQTPGLPEK